MTDDNLSSEDVLRIGRTGLNDLSGHQFDLITISKPDHTGLALNLLKIISKLSPMVGNLIEHEVCDYLNTLPDLKEYGVWRRQDPDFPDAIFDSDIRPIPGFEIKAWFPLATEITARFKESQKYFFENNTDLVLLAWLPEHLFYGAPKLIDIVSIPASKIAKSRDDHYYNPPDYIVLEPENTDTRTRNLQQSCVNGHKFQGTVEELKEARELISSHGGQYEYYSIGFDFQEQLQNLVSSYRYRLDTNFAKIDRIDNEEIEAFKTRVLNTIVHGRKIQDWSRLFSKANDEELSNILAEEFDIHHGLTD